MNYKKAILTIATLGFTYFIVTRVGFTAQQYAYLRKLNPKGRKRFKEFIKAIEDNLGYSVIITSGYRTFEKQQQLKDDGISPVGAGRSFHNYGLAIDINLLKLGQYVKMGSSRQKWLNTGVPQLAEGLGFRWGGDFSGYYDPVHFDLGNDYNINELEAKAYELYGTNPSDIKGNLV